MNLWQNMGSLNDLEKGIRRATSKNVDIINLDYINKLFFLFDKQSFGKFDKFSFTNTLKQFFLEDHKYN